MHNNYSALIRALQVAIEGLEYTNRYFKNPMPGFACMECDMGGSGYSTNGSGYHDDKEPHVCTHVKVDQTLSEIRGMLGCGE